MGSPTEPASPSAPPAPATTPAASPATEAPLSAERRTTFAGGTKLKRSLGEASPNAERPKPKRVNSYSELNFASIVRVDSLAKMALPAFGEDANAPSLDDDEPLAAADDLPAPPAPSVADGRAEFPGAREGRSATPSPAMITLSPGPTSPPPAVRRLQRNHSSFAELGADLPPSPRNASTPAVPIGGTVASPPIAIAPGERPRSPPPDRGRTLAASAPRFGRRPGLGFADSLELGGYSPGGRPSDSWGGV